MYKTKERYYIIPKKEWYNKETGCMRNFFKIFEDYEIKECTEAKIKEMIDTYNLEQDVKYFDRFKTEHFYFVRAKEIEIGKYRTGKIEILDLWKK